LGQCIGEITNNNSLRTAYLSHINMKRFDGKKALITGANSGIGLATAQAFVSEGAQVLLVGRNAERLGAAAEQIGGQSRIYIADLSQMDDIRALGQSLQQDGQRLDIAFLNAGIFHPTPLSSTDEATYDQIMNTNTKGVFFTMQALLPVMNQPSCMVLNNSVAAHFGQGYAIYSASKASCNAFMRATAAELMREYQIRINSVSPGPILTPIFHKAGMTDEQIAGIGPITLSGRVGQPEEVAQAVLYLCSEQASYTVGVELFVDGGYMLA
jgi:NAD(P)-dependent dehydrogenase (short-subunit alcohol dehydrogenase family)